MPTILPTKSIYYNDCVLISNKPGVVKSRKDIPRELNRICVSPMTSIIGKDFVKESASCGLSIMIPRFYHPYEKIELFRIFKDNKTNENQLCFMGIGASEPSANVRLIEAKVSPKQWVIDIAFAGIPQLESSIIELKKLAVLKDLCIGNIMCGSELRRLSQYKRYCEKLYIRLGVSGGNPCSTSDVTSFGRGQISEQIECFGVKKELNEPNIYQIGDGGVKHSGYCLKAFGAGCDMILMGRYFANASEADTNIKGEHQYWGLASWKQIELSKLCKTHSEGKIRKINRNDIKPLKDLVEELWGGISSGISFSGYPTLSDFIGNGIFQIKENSLPPKDR